MKEFWTSHWTIDAANAHVRHVEDEYLVNLAYEMVDVCNAHNEAPLDPVYSLIYQELQAQYQQEVRRQQGTYPFTANES